MTATIAGFVTRAQADLDPPRSISRRIDPSRGGAAIHYGGPDQQIASHRDCVARWRAWQRFHMGKGWTDIAYTGGFCQHGYALAGRGFGVRTAANGTNDANGRYYAFCWIGGGGEVPTSAAVGAAAWWVAEARRAGDAATDVAAHSSFKATACPGDLLRAVLDSIDHLASTTPPLIDPPQEDDMARFVKIDASNDIYEVLGDRLVKVANSAVLNYLGGAGNVDTDPPAEIKRLPVATPTAEHTHPDLVKLGRTVTIRGTIAG